MPKETINGFEMHYEVRGEGTPVALIHGGFGGISSTLSTRSEPWVPTFLDAGYQVITYDRRAAHQSDYPEDGYTLENFALDLRELLRHLNVERAHIIGTSGGGPIAVTYALHYRETMKSLVLVNTSPALLAEPKAAERMRARLELLEREGPEAAYEARREQPLGMYELVKRRAAEAGVDEATMAKTPGLGQGGDAQVKRSTREERVRWYAGEVRNYAAYAGVDLTSRLRELRLPAFIIHGDGDSIVPVKGSYTLAEHIPNAELRILEGEEHGLLTRPTEAPAAIVAFLRALEAGSGAK